MEYLVCIFKTINKYKAQILGYIEIGVVTIFLLLVVGSLLL